MTKILIVDDHPLYREGVMTALRGQPLQALVLGASSASEALRILDDDPTVDLVLVDLRLGKEDGLEGLKQIGSRHPPIARMLISGHESPGIVRAAMGAGAQGFLSKSLSIGQVLRAIHTVLDGGVSWPTSSQSPPAAEPDTVPATDSRGPAAVSHGLTLRQLEVLSLLGRGNSNAEIAEALGIGERTAKAHMKAIFGALGVDTRVKAVIRARELGLLG
jgi:DNA-binding NarL/FixJ family response regulator